MGLFSTLLNGGKNQDSSAAANQYLNQIPGEAHKNLDPYIMPGEQAQGFVDKILASYKPSAGYQFKENRLRQGMANNSAAGGFSGTQYDQENQSGLMNALMSEDMQQYLQNILGVHNNSFAASQDLNNNTVGALNQQGGLAFGKAEANNSRNASLRDALLGLGGQLGGAYMGMPTGGGGGGSTGGASGGGMMQALSKLFGGGGGTSGGAYAPPGGVGPQINGYGGGAYRSTVPGSAWMR